MMHDLKFDKKRFYSDGMEIIVDDIVEGIAQRRAITGGDLPQLEPETIARKLHDHQLVDKGLLSDPYTYQRLNQWRVDKGIVTVKPRTKGGDLPRNEVAAGLQLLGVGRKRKKFFFFGISKDAVNKIMALAGEIMLEALEAL